MQFPLLRILLVALSGSLAITQAQDIQIKVQADRVSHRVSRYLTGACIEDVNHEVYGGIDSQMIFGESFAEPVPSPRIHGFTAYGGRWEVSDGELQAPAGDGPKLVSALPPFAEGEASVEVCFPEAKPGNAGLILKVSDPRTGADNFTGYEIALETSGRLVLGRHRRNWEPIRNLPCEVPVDTWIKLTARMTASTIEVFVDDRSITKFEDNEHPLATGTVGLRTWQREAQFRNLTVTAGGQPRKLPFGVAPADAWGHGVSGPWRALRRGSAVGKFNIETNNAFSGRQSQRLTFSAGEGELGIENQSLNQWGMNFVRAKLYEGFVCVRADQPTEVFVALESRNGATIYAEKRLKVPANKWQRLNFKLRPKDSDTAGRFALKLKQPGSVVVGYAFLQPGDWGRFKGLPIRKDVAEGLIDQGITVLRQGGCMANAAEYRWKKMIGPRERRPPYVGWWYPYSSNGWGIFDFLNFCEAAGFLGIPDVNMGETPQDMADFMEYVNGPTSSEWGQRRAADGHPAPYHLKYLQLGNEERVDDKYADKFELLAKAIWAKDPSIILVVGDFAYTQPIENPFDFRGAVSGITNLLAQQRILRLAKQHAREVWFDVHVGTEGPRPDAALTGMFAFRDALGRIADGAKHKVVVFEFNAGNHSQRRAIANALAIQAIERDGDIPIATSANCLQPDRQNDNDWDQGLLFLNPAKVWLQPPGYVTQMFSHNYQPELVKCELTGSDGVLDASANRSPNGRLLVVHVANPTARPVTAQLHLVGFVPKKRAVQVTELAAPLASRNTAEQPKATIPQERQWQPRFVDGRTSYTFPPYSVSVLRFE